ncbi:hypothetical protein, partial [Paracidovorax citrulli]
PRPRLFARRIERYAVPVIPTASIFADRSMNLEAGDWCWYAPPPGATQRKKTLLIDSIDWNLLRKLTYTNP